MDVNDIVLVPIQLQAFVLNEKVCNTGEDDDKGARIIPITQPNYTFLRLDNFFIQSDVLNHADLHNAAPAQTNSRTYDLGATPPGPRTSRFGVYVHWILPQAYRSGVVAADSVSDDRHDHERLKRGLPARAKQPSEGGHRNKGTPEYLQPPTRWIIVRKLDLESVDPPEAKQYMKEYEAWVLESDYLWDLDDIPPDYDLQVDVSPFIVGQSDGGTNIDEQAEVFIGRKTPLEDYLADPDATYANISILRSGNQFFADFQLHNSNVFSILDNFEYFDTPGSANRRCPNRIGQGKHLKKATASYYLLGCHSSSSTDPLFDETKRSTHEMKLEGIFMTLKESGLGNVADEFLNATSPARLCLHGAMYDVKWDLDSKPEYVPADDYSEILHNQDLPAFSVGTTPLDALITYCTARKGKEKDKVIEKLEEEILAIDSLLHARDDGVEGQREAKDMVYNWNFSRAQAGTHYFIAGEDDGKQCKRPDDKIIAVLKELNEYQQVLDACDRAATQYRWDMFSLWWTYATDVADKNPGNKTNKDYKTKAEGIATHLNNIQSYMTDLGAHIETLIGNADALKKSTLPFYYRARDPTVLLGGIPSGWPEDFSKNVDVRLVVQCVTNPTPPPEELIKLVPIIESSFPGTPLAAASNLLTEFWALLPDNLAVTKPADGQTYPQFHAPLEGDIDGTPPRDQWQSRQPWFPLYVEWEVEYTHVPFELWSLQEQAARLSSPKVVRYGIPATDETPLWERMAKGEPSPSENTRIISGRVLILPQPSFSLMAKVKQLFDDTPPKLLDPYLDESDRQYLVDHLSRLSYLSCPLAGLTEGLLTLSTGAHIKPENNYVTDGGQEYTIAMDAAEYPDAGFDKTNIELIRNNSAFTPYANLSDFSRAEFCPFKPATHGQFRFTKFNVIDKFGQALVAIDPKPLPGPRQLPPLYPAISDFYEPQVVTVDGVEVANTVLQNDGTKCEFIQLPPQINQNARLNAYFVMHDMNTPAQQTSNPPSDDTEGSSYWRPVTEWENPIWGWLVINYADCGIQIFLEDGTFYREVRITPIDPDAEPKWLPFAEDKNVPRKENAQLDALIDKLKEKDYLMGFWTMIKTAILNMPPTPSSYAQFLGSIIGKPLALVNMGWSLELDGYPLRNQSTTANVKSPERHLIPQFPEDTSSYELQVKLGDAYREYDGLVGYFDSKPNPGPQDEGKELIVDYVNTYFVAESMGDPPAEPNLHPIDTTNYPGLTPYWIKPFHDEHTPTQYADARNRQLRVFGAIVDPFTPIHGLSSFLPAVSLQLDSWTWQEAMQNITAFFHAGPLNVPKDTGDYEADHPLTTSSMKEPPTRNVSLPSLSTGDWSWLQPFVDPGDPEGTVFNSFGIEKTGNLMSPGFENGPYTAIEGFLQLRRPVMTGDPKKDDDA